MIAPATGDEDESLVAGVTGLANAEEDELPIDIADAATSEEYVGDEELEEDEEGAAVAEEPNQTFTGLVLKIIKEKGV